MGKGKKRGGGGLTGKCRIRTILADGDKKLLSARGGVNPKEIGG